MVVIRFARIGSTNRPKYRVVVADSRKPLKGRFIEVLGHFNPFFKESAVLDKQKYEAWIKKGAQASQRVKSLYNKMR